MKIPQWNNYAPDDCSIGKYELYSSAEEQSTAFDPVFELLDDEQMVQFGITNDLKNTKATYTYIVRISDITESEDVIFEPSARYSFETVCGGDTFVPSRPLEAEEVYDIDGNQPALYVPVWESYSP